MKKDLERRILFLRNKERGKDSLKL